MEYRIQSLTFRVVDLARSRAFYVDGLGWPLDLEQPGDFFTLSAHPFLHLSFMRGERSAAVLDPGRTKQDSSLLRRDCESRQDVDQPLARAREAGATVIDPCETASGGDSGAFTDPDGLDWEVTHEKGGGRLVIALA